MSIRIDCRCGFAVEGNDIQEVIDLATQHDDKCKSKEKT